MSSVSWLGKSGLLKVTPSPAYWVVMDGPQRWQLPPCKSSKLIVVPAPGKLVISPARMEPLAAKRLHKQRLNRDNCILDMIKLMLRFRDQEVSSQFRSFDGGGSNSGTGTTYQLILLE